MKDIVKFLGWAAMSGLFLEGLAWALRVDLTHWVKMGEQPSLAAPVYCDRVTQRYWYDNASWTGGGDVL